MIGRFLILPTLIRQLPSPLRRMVGDLLNEKQVLVGVGLVAEEPTRNGPYPRMQPMTILDSTVDGLRQQNATLQDRLEVAEETLRAIRSGEVDAITVETPAGVRVFTLGAADQQYRMLVETMSEGAVAVAHRMVSSCSATNDLWTWPKPTSA